MKLHSVQNWLSSVADHYLQVEPPCLANFGTVVKTALFSPSILIDLELDHSIGESNPERISISPQQVDRNTPLSTTIKLDSEPAWLANSSTVFKSVSFLL